MPSFHVILSQQHSIIALNIKVTFCNRSNSRPFPAINVRDTQVMIDCVGNVMAHAQKPNFVFRRNGPVHLNRRGRQFSRLLAAEVCASAVVMPDTPCSELV
jgi:hypothetical protein